MGECSMVVAGMNRRCGCWLMSLLIVLLRQYLLIELMLLTVWKAIDAKTRVATVPAGEMLRRRQDQADCPDYLIGTSVLRGCLASPCGKSAGRFWWRATFECDANFSSN